ncbi:uncharacterized protein LOC116204456 [Punica granatum]|uniref:Uncharacterized protein LOC116204456 n=2 Tax=Punica granatum TaxID=22663 RepID=A0A6P8DGC4_PUNGR|nr:uncharacterized protein LOC116204456 [Punica granatum]PKI66386.1 hypothetical protein CRG98_013188 [Punica granatum]
MENEAQPSFLPRTKSPGGSTVGAVELKAFEYCLQWIFVDQSTLWRAGLSWSVFFLLTVAAPLASLIVLQCRSTCDEDHRRPYQVVVQVSLSVFAAISFICLSRWARKYGLRRFLFLDKLSDASDTVRRGYALQLQSSLKFWCCFIFPCFLLETAYKVWWYITGGSAIPHYGNIYVSDTMACAMELLSWLYRVSIYFLVCVLYQLSCYLQILRIEDFAHVFLKETEVGSILKEHLRVRRCLRIISHRFRIFTLLSLVLVTATLFISLLLLTRSGAHTNVLKAGDLSLCSISLATGLFICLRSAAKTTHKAHSLTGLAAKWHVCATIDSFDEGDGETPRAPIISSSQLLPLVEVWESDGEEGEGDDELDNANINPIVAHTISFHKRQALVNYLENNRAGITMFGFTLDRTWLHTIFAIELALLLWLLNKTIGIS